MVLAELSGAVAEVLEQAADRRVQLAHAHRRAGEADLGQAGADAVLPGEKCRAAGGARLLTVIVLERDALAADAVDVGRLVDPSGRRSSADVRYADIVAADDEDIRFAAGWTAAGCGCCAGAICGRSTVLRAAGCKRAPTRPPVEAAEEAVVRFLALSVVCCRSSGACRTWLLLRDEDRRSSAAPSLLTHRKPTWLVDVSTGSAWRAAGR